MLPRCPARATHPSLPPPPPPFRLSRMHAGWWDVSYQILTSSSVFLLFPRIAFEWLASSISLNHREFISVANPPREYTLLHRKESQPPFRFVSGAPLRGVKVNEEGHRGLSDYLSSDSSFR